MNTDRRRRAHVEKHTTPPKGKLRTTNHAVKMKSVVGSEGGEPILQNAMKSMGKEFRSTLLVFSIC